MSRAVPKGERFRIQSTCSSRAALWLTGFSGSKLTSPPTPGKRRDWVLISLKFGKEHLDGESRLASFFSPYF